MAPSKKPLVFVSYAHADEPEYPREHEVQWLSWVQSQFKPLERLGVVEYFSDRSLLSAQDWKARILDNLARCDLFILLVSSDSLSSTFIVDTEVKAILDRQRASGSTEQPLLLPIVIRPVDDRLLNEYEWLKTPNRRPRDGKALSELPMTAGVDLRTRAMAEIVGDVRELLKKISGSTTAKVEEEPKEPLSEGLIEISPDELDAWLERARAEQWRYLVIFGPSVHAAGRYESWPESLRVAGRVFRLDAPIEAPPATLLALSGLTLLDLPGNNIGAEGAKAIAASLTGLAALDLGSNEIGDEGAKAISAKLTGLRSLNLGSNRIGAAGAKAIAAKLTGLTSLDLWSNEIGAEGAKAIAASLTALTWLDLSFNGIGDEGAKAIAAKLTGLASLGLSYNGIGDEGVKAIAAKLTGLTSLELSYSGFGDEGAKAIAAKLNGLTSLDLSRSNIGAEGAKAIAASLTGLTSLDLRSNKIGDAGAKAIAASLTALTSLDLGSNKIGDAGAKAIAASLTRLTSLILSENDISDAGAKAIAASLTRLTSLILSENEIGTQGARTILESWSARTDSLQLQRLDLRDNGDLSRLLPKEALETDDAQTILAAYRRFKQAQAQGTARPLNEVKLLVVGNEAVGKTSLLNFLIDGKKCDPHEKRTPGITQRERIEIKAWSPNESEVRLNVWDFGGQEMMRGTHRFFLTERSLYLLLFEDRREDERTIHDWLKTIRNRGAESPILVVINKSDEGKQDLRLPEDQLAKDYPNIDGFLRTSCNPGEWAEQSIAALRTKIVETILNDTRLKHVRDPIPNNWLAIKNKVAEMAAKRALLSQSEFVKLCVAPGEGLKPVADEDEQRALLRVLHELGVIVAHGLKRDAPAARREITLLDPNWLTEAIYGVLDKARSVEQEGEFSRAQLAEWLDPARYPPERHEFILDMMLDPDIGLCFRLPTPKEERYLIPEGLSPNPRYFGDWSADCLRFRFQYKFLPPGLIPRFIVQAHRHLTPEKARWRTGVVLKVRDCPTLVKADMDQRRVDIEVKGPPGMRRAALNIVLDDLEFVHGLNPEAEPMAYVPLPDDPKLQARYDHLLTLEGKKGPDYEFFPEGAEREYRVCELLDGVRRDETRLRDGLRGGGRD